MSLAFRVCALDEVASTNDVVKHALDAGEPEGLVVRARRQVAGYGRQGRAWTSPEGGLYCSLLLRPQVLPRELPTLSLVVGMAVRRAIVSLAGEDTAEAVRIKWPNDVVLMPGFVRTGAVEESLAQNRAYERFSRRRETSDLGFHEAALDYEAENRSYLDFYAKAASLDAHGASASADALGGTAFEEVAMPAKLCGISLEANGGGVCVGVGVNVVPPAQRPDVGGKNRAAYVNDLALDAPPSIESVLDAFLDAFAPLYDEWTRAGFAALVDEFNARAVLIGRVVSVADRDGRALAEGIVQRVDAHGRLVLVDASGAEVPVSSGEAHLF